MLGVVGRCLFGLGSPLWARWSNCTCSSKNMSSSRLGTGGMGGLIRKLGRAHFIKGYDIILIYRWYFNGGYNIMIIVKIISRVHDIKNDNCKIVLKLH